MPSDLCPAQAGDEKETFYPQLLGLMCPLEHGGGSRTTNDGSPGMNG